MSGPDPNIHAGPDWISWDGQTISLTGSTSYTGYSTIEWIASPQDGITIVDGNTLTPDVTVTTSDFTAYTLKLDIDGTYDIMKIDVYLTACEATIAAGKKAENPSDIAGDDCRTTLADFALLAASWLNDKNLTASRAKN
jgi:hypothetical protein